MHVRTLNAGELGRLYQTELKKTFPPEERKPLSAMLRLLREGEYIPLAYYAEDGGALLGYALLWTEGADRPVLLDYFAVSEALRGQGIGAELLRELGAFLAGRALIIEAEAPDGGAEDALRQRRLDFYTRCGAEYLPYDCWLFGVTYRVLALGGAADGQTLMEAHRSLYLRHRKRLMRKYVRIPLVPGEALPESIPWSETEDE